MTRCVKLTDVSVDPRLVPSIRFCSYSHDSITTVPKAHNYARSITIPVYMSGKSMHRSPRLNPILKFSGQVCFTHYLQINPRGRTSRSCSAAVKLAMTVFALLPLVLLSSAVTTKKINRVKVASISAGGGARYRLPIPLLLCGAAQIRRLDRP